MSCSSISTAARVTCPIQDSGLDLRYSQRWSISSRTHTRAHEQWRAAARAPGCQGGDKIQVSLLPSHCFLLQKKGWQPTACTQNVAHGQPHTRAAAPTGFSSWCSPGEAFSLVVWASARGTCFGVLLNTCLSWCPAPELWVLRDRKGPKIPAAPETVHAPNAKVLVGVLLGPHFLVWEVKI